ncbi:MAG: SdrD B-like domain-containing protein [Verrucomicrobiales bacterium]
MASPRTSIFGSGGANGITALYLANYAGAAKAFVDQKLLVQMDTLGIAGLTFDAQAPIGATQPRFGEYGYGGLEISPDGNFLYAANLGKRNLLKIDISGVDYAQLPTTAPTAADVVEISLPATYAGFTDGVEGYFRPTAMSEYAGVIYIGGTFDGSLLADDSAVRIVVLALDPADDSITEVFSYDPTAFTRGNFSYKGGIHTRWTAAPESGGGFTNPVPPMQPVVSDLTFDDYGALNLGVTDRSVYNLNSSNQVGYSIGTWRNPDGSFTLESGNSRGPLAGATVGTGTSPFDRVSPDGPGGQFFYDQSEGHPFLYSGGLLNIPGTDTVLGGWADALDLNAFGVRYNKTSDGQIKGGIHLGGGKQFAIVGVDAVCELGPIEIGNRVWQDLDDNGVQDAGEPAIAGVTVQLLDGSGAVISSVATTPDGNYVFSSDPARADAPGADYGIAGFAHGGTYTVRIPDAQGGSQQAALSGLFLIPKNGGADTIDSDADLSGGDAVVAVATGMEGENSHDYDFGFSASPPPCAISEIVVTAGPCNDNGTPGNAGDDFYLAAVTVGFASPPATGSLALTGDASASVPVGSLDSATSHTFSGVVLPADGAAKSITATFSADPACTLTNPAIAAVNACSSCAAAAALLAKP